MSTGLEPGGLKLTEEEAFSLLGLCLTSPQGLDAVSEKALRKLAEYCTSRCNHTEINSNIAKPVYTQRELKLDRAGA
jgi:hypothetical protein